MNVGAQVTAFWARVAKRDTGCWEWTGAGLPSGYGVFRIGEPRRRDYAHRISLRLAGRTLGTEDVVCHRCDNRRCVNPAHLFVATHADNVADMVAKGRQHKGETHGLAKLTEAQAREVLRLHAAGLRHTEIARAFGIGDVQVSRIVRGKRWKHLHAA